MKKVIFVLLAIVLSGILFFLLKNSQDKPLKVKETQIISEKHEDKVVGKVPHLQPEKPKVLAVTKQEKPTLKPFAVKNVLQKKDLLNNIDEDAYIQQKVDIVLNEFQNTLPKLIEELKKVPACLENAKSIDEAFECHKLVDAMNNRLCMVVGISDVDENNATVEYIWDDGTKTEMIEEVKNRISSVIETQRCMEAVSTASEIDACLDRKENQ